MKQEEAIQKFLEYLNITANRDILIETLSTNSIEDHDKNEMYSMGYRDGQTEFAKSIINLWAFFQGTINE